MPELTELDRDLMALAADLKRLEAEYTMFFAGRSKRPPWETRGRVEATLKRWNRGAITGTSQRFRFEMLQSRFQSLSDLWDRALRAKEEGRASALAPPPVAAAAAVSRVEAAAAPVHAPAGGRTVVHVTSFTDPVREIDKLRVLYDTLMEARRSVGDADVPFDTFAALVSSQVSTLREQGSAEAAFRVSVQEGKVTLTVRGLKGADAAGSAERPETGGAQHASGSVSGTS